LRCELRGGLAGGRREMRIEVGPIHVTVTEVPGAMLTDEEWRDVRLARLSFIAMWGGRDDSATSERDPIDGRGDDAVVYDTKHYLARVEEAAEPVRLVTGRKVVLRADGLSVGQRAEPGELLPLDIRFWRDRTTGGSLWPRLRDHARALAPADQLAEFRIASMGRVATYPFGERGRTAGRRERTAIAWAATQILAADGDSNLLWVWTICPEFQDKVMVVRGIDGSPVRPPFMRTDEALGLPAGTVVLDRELPLVERTVVAAPGYFFENGSAAEVLAALLDEGRLTIADLRSTIARLVESEAGSGQPSDRLDELLMAVSVPDHHRLANILTRPRSMKCLIPLLTGAELLSRISTAAFRARLLNEVADGPFSACVAPRSWSAAAWTMLETADRTLRPGGTARTGEEVEQLPMQLRA
jgi:hypothetical protein